MKSAESRYNRLYYCLVPAILILTYFIFKSSLNSLFLYYDDTDNVVNNLLIKDLSTHNILLLFKTNILYMYTPVTMLTYAIDNYLSGMEPYYFKLTNLIIHIVNILLVYFTSSLLLKNIKLAVIIALIFAVHPINVDTISWISARSNLLAFTFFFSGLFFYLKYIDKIKILFLFISLLFFMLSVLSKSAGIMLPFILILTDYYKGRKINLRTLSEKIPFVIVSLAIGLLTLYFRTDSATNEFTRDYNLSDKIILVCYSYIIYIYHLTFPVHLSEIYSYPVKQGLFLPFEYYLSAFLFIVLIILFLLKRKLLSRGMIFGILFFVINLLVPQSAYLEDGFTANRYSYLPSFGYYLAVIIILNNLIIRYRKVKLLSYIILSVVIIVFSFQTNIRSQYWKNSVSLFDHAIKQSPESAFAYNNRGITKYFNNDFKGALNDYNNAVLLNPLYSGAYYNRGIIYFATSANDYAYRDFSKAIELNPAFASSYMSRGIIEMEIYKNFESALKDYNMAIKINPGFAQAYYNRGLLKFKMNEPESACNDFFMVKKLGFPNADDIIKRFCE